MSEEVDWVGFLPKCTMEKAQRAFALLRAIQVAPDNATPECVIEIADKFIAWLNGMGAKP